MSQQSHIYVIAFDSGTLKVGRAANAARRLAAHRREAARHGIAITSQWSSVPCDEDEAAAHEQQLIAFCESRGARRAGWEYFDGLEFHDVRSFAETLACAGGSLPAKSVSRSQAIADELRQAIEAGEMLPGALLPSERELMARYRISSATVSKVITLLKSAGLVVSEVGRGVFVRRRPELIRHAHDRYARHWRESGKAPFRAEVEAQGRTARVEVASIARIDPPQWVAERLGLSAGERVLRRENTYYVDDSPVQIVNTYIPLSIAEGTPLEQEVPGPGGIYAAFEEQGHRLTRMLEEVQARMPRNGEVERLNAEPGMPVLDVLHVSYDQDETPMDVSHFVLRGDENVLTYELPTE